MGEKNKFVDRIIRDIYSSSWQEMDINNRKMQYNIYENRRLL